MCKSPNWIKIPELNEMFSKKVGDDVHGLRPQEDILCLPNLNRDVFNVFQVEKLYSKTIFHHLKLQTWILIL